MTAFRVAKDIASRSSVIFLFYLKVVFFAWVFVIPLLIVISVMPVNLTENTGYFIISFVASFVFACLSQIAFIEFLNGISKGHYVMLYNPRGFFISSYLLAGVSYAISALISAEDNLIWMAPATSFMFTALFFYIAWSSKTNNE